MDDESIRIEKSDASQISNLKPKIEDTEPSPYEALLSRKILSVNETRMMRNLGPSTSHISSGKDNTYMRVFELEHEITALTSKLENRKSPQENMSPEAILTWKNDLLEVQIISWKFKIDDLENKFQVLKKAHSNVIDALLKARIVNSDNDEIQDMRLLLRNRKNDAYEVSCLIHELKKVAWQLLPESISKFCKEIDSKMERLKLRLEESQLECHNLKLEVARIRGEIVTLQLEIIGEERSEDLYEMKIAKTLEIKESMTKKLAKLIKKVNTGNEILGSFGLSKKSSSLLTIERQSPTTSKDIDGPNDLRSDGIFEEKIEFLNDKMKEIEAEISATKEEIRINSQKNMEKNKDNEALANEIETLRNVRNEVMISLQQEILLRKTYYNEIEDLKGKIRVYCRCRPISKVEKDNGNIQCVTFPDIYTVSVLGIQKDRGAKEFQFDKVYSMNSTQAQIFQDTSRLVQSAFDGFNVCIFAYGQTGSGKTHTLIGDLESSPGIVPRIFDEVFHIINNGMFKFKTELKCYMLELYNEKLLDLMNNEAEYSDKLEIKKDHNGMVIVPTAELLPANRAAELRELFIKGNRNRHIASTKMNSESSRSHLILSIIISSRLLSSNKFCFGKISIIDLAGSERLAKSGVKGIGAQEAMSINMSLSALGDVISALTLGNPFIPYRNNKLTMLMQDSLGGNAKTLMFVTISPVDYNRVETLSSLTYAARVKLVKNDALKLPDSEEIVILQKVIQDLLAGTDVIL